MFGGGGCFRVGGRGGGKFSLNFHSGVELLMIIGLTFSRWNRLLGHSMLA
jgi:hypothetical protein